MRCKSYAAITIRFGVKTFIVRFIHKAREKLTCSEYHNVLFLYFLEAIDGLVVWLSFKREATYERTMIEFCTIKWISNFMDTAAV